MSRTQVFMLFKKIQDEREDITDGKRFGCATIWKTDQTVKATNGGEIITGWLKDTGIEHEYGSSDIYFDQRCEYEESLCIMAIYFPTQHFQ